MTGLTPKAVSLTGWGGTSPTVAHVVRPNDLRDLRAVLAGAGDRGVIVRGLGRSYGDPAQNAGGTVVDLTSWNTMVDVDTNACTARVQAGVSIGRLVGTLLPLGLWPPVLPGTGHATVGGAVSADVHGKNHHLDRSFGNHVTSLSILLATGDLVEAAPDGEHADLFWATIGGMGLTGVVVQATIRLIRVESSFLIVDTMRTHDVEGLLSTLSDRDDVYRYSVAWLDGTITGPSLGRAVVTRGNAATIADLPPDLRSRALRAVSPGRGRMPFRPPVNLINGSAVRAFNAWRFANTPDRRIGEIREAASFFHPLDTVDHWNRAYGRRGLCQYQFVMPFGEEAAFCQAIETIAASEQVPSLTVLKRLGPGNPSPMSFPIPGWTLAADFPVRAGLDRLLDHLDRLVLAVRGRVYLAKDSRTNAATIAGMYPRLDEFRATRDTYDPKRLFCSDLSRRLDL